MSQRLKSYQPSAAMDVLLRVAGCSLDYHEYMGILRGVVALLAYETDYLYDESELMPVVVRMVQDRRTEWMRGSL